ncbi:M16 family metallopeptidase [Prevotella sp.]|uniref:M16 family metallopeptidase n=1 Tax=Prevotella sp. TaxID=59823 RepID=UPI003AB31193
MQYNTYTLTNGLRVIHLPSASPVVYCGYGICAGTRDEHPGEEGIAHFCEHTTFKGTAKRTSLQILNCLERVGGDLNAFTNKEDTVFYAAILKEHIARAVDLLTDMVFHSTYPQAEIDKEIEVICDEIECYNDSPAELIYDEFENAIFSGHPLGHNILGRAERLREYTTDNALSFTRRFYRPENAVFFAYGDISFSRLIKLLEKATADFPPCSPLLDTMPKGLLPEYNPQELLSQKNTHQAHVMIGNRAYSVHDDKRMALYLLNNILGGPGMNARLNIALREKHGLVYTVDSSMVSYSDTGMWCTYFGCDPKDVKKCRRLVMRELDRMAQKPMSAAQLAAAKRQIKGQIGVACDNRESFALDFAKSFLHYGWEKDITSLMARIDRIEASEMQLVAQEVFNSDSLTVLTFL